VHAQGATTTHRLDGDIQAPADCWREQMQDFVDSIVHARRPRVDGIEASRVVALVDALYDSKRSRGLPATAPVPGLTW
jgi:hypothetical protein